MEKQGVGSGAVGACGVLNGALMSAHTSMKVGGPAERFFEPEDEISLVELVRENERAGAPYFLLGNGTNVIVRDGGYPGAVISTLKALTGIEALKSGDGTHAGVEASKSEDGTYAGIEVRRSEVGIETLRSGDGTYAGVEALRSGDGTYAGIEALRSEEGALVGLVCGAGEPLGRVCRFAASVGLSGLEAVSGIPGTVGGAVFMNAGAYGSEISDVLVSVKAFDLLNDNNIMVKHKECHFGYRKSVFKEGHLVILSVRFGLVPGKREEIEASMAEYARRRNEKQPLELPSSGSFFKRPEGGFASRLIEEAGMKGARVGGAQVSEKHSGFIVNTGGATASDVLALADLVKARVFETSGIRLEEEPLVIGI